MNQVVSELDVFDPANWYRLPKSYRSINIDERYLTSLVGFRIDHFIPSLSQFVPIDLGIADAMHYIFYNCPSRIESVMVAKDGHLVRGLVSVSRNNETNHVGVHYAHDLIISQLGFRGSSQIPDYEKEYWYLLNGSMAYRIQPDGNINCGKYGFAQSFNNYQNELDKNLNLKGVVDLPRDYPNRSIAEKYRKS